MNTDHIIQQENNDKITFWSPIMRDAKEFNYSDVKKLFKQFRAFEFSNGRSIFIAVMLSFTVYLAYIDAYVLNW